MFKVIEYSLRGGGLKGVQPPSVIGIDDRDPWRQAQTLVDE